MQRLKEESSSHGDTLSDACLAGAMHDRSSMMASTTVLTRVMWISVLKVDKRIDGDDGF
jgi:hypothetical protein